MLYITDCEKKLIALNRSQKFIDYRTKHDFHRLYFVLIL